VTTRQAPKRRGRTTVAAIVTDPGPRYNDYVLALIGVLNHHRYDANLAWIAGVDITGGCNEACRKMLEHDSDWLWLIGDDHVFEPNILQRMLAHNVDVLVPFCLKRAPAFQPVIYGSENPDGSGHSVAEIPRQGLFEVYASGQAGMLIHRRVLEAMSDPWFETFGKQNEDLMFSRKIREAGFKIMCDPTIHLGHIALACVWPVWAKGNEWNEEEGEWSVRVDFGPEGGNKSSTIEDWSLTLGQIGNSLTAL